MIINKFGGEIMGSFKLVRLAVQQIKKQLSHGQKPVVVVSALAGVTDMLVELCERYNQNLVERLWKKHEEWGKNVKCQMSNVKTESQILKLNLEADLKRFHQVKNKLVVQDRILAIGEKLSSLLFTELLRQNGIQAIRFTGEELGVITDSNFGDADVDYAQSVKKIRTQIKKSQISNLKSQNYISNLKSFDIVPVITGFIGQTQDGQTTTLGRGGSDTTACLVGAALKAQKVILWKNVPGVLTADPKVVKNAKTIKFLTYDQAEKIGKVIHHKSMNFVKRAGIPVEVVYIQNPCYKTLIYAKN